MHDASLRCKACTTTADYDADYLIDDDLRDTADYRHFTCISYHAQAIGKRARSLMQPLRGLWDYGFASEGLVDGWIVPIGHKKSGFHVVALASDEKKYKPAGLEKNTNQLD